MARKRRTRWKEGLKDLLSMHRDERRGITVLVLLLFILAVIVCYLQWFRPPKVHDMAAMEAQMAAWITELETEHDTVEIKPFPFDPNTIGREEWRALGLTDKQIDGLERYQNKGGHFRTKKDLGRMYSIKPELFARLEPFILLPDSLTRKAYPKKDRAWEKEHAERKGPYPERATHSEWTIRTVELNSADTIGLIAVRGIGPAFARSIVKYREVLGGYVSLDQLAEVYILRDKPDAVLRLKELLTLDPSLVRRIPINTCTADDLAAHPYVRWKLAKTLVAYRTHHGPFATVADIQGCPLVVDSVFRKLAPYLSVE
jgi:competence protein ComEA